MDKTNLGESLKKFREHKKKSMGQMSNEIQAMLDRGGFKPLPEKLKKFNKGSISRWESGESEPQFTALQIMSVYFGVTVDDLVKGNIEGGLTTMYTKLTHSNQNKVLTLTKRLLKEQDGDHSRVINLSDYVDEKLYGYVSAGRGEYLSDEAIDTVSVRRKDIPLQSYDIMLKVNGDSMRPMFEHGEYVFVKKTEEVRNGQFAVFIINGESYLKKVYVENGRLILISLNERYPDMIFNENDNIELVGTVVL